MKTVPMPDNERDEGFLDKTMMADWKESIDEVLKNFDEQLEEYDLEVVQYDYQGDTYVWAIQPRAKKRRTK